MHSKVLDPRSFSEIKSLSSNLPYQLSNILPISCQIQYENELFYIPDIYNVSLNVYNKTKKALRSITHTSLPHSYSSANCSQYLNRTKEIYNRYQHSEEKGVERENTTFFFIIRRIEKSKGRYQSISLEHQKNRTIDKNIKMKTKRRMVLKKSRDERTPLKSHKHSCQPLEHR